MPPMGVSLIREFFYRAQNHLEPVFHYIILFLNSLRKSIIILAFWDTLHHLNLGKTADQKALLCLSGNKDTPVSHCRTARKATYCILSNAIVQPFPSLKPASLEGTLNNGRFPKRSLRELDVRWLTRTIRYITHIRTGE